VRHVTYCKEDENETEVDKEHLVKAYRYGKSYVPFISDDELKITAAKRLALISFARNQDVCSLFFSLFFWPVF
jgi:non-homologous end joining protein Ku